MCAFSTREENVRITAIQPRERSFARYWGSFSIFKCTSLNLCEVTWQILWVSALILLKWIGPFPDKILIEVFSRITVTLSRKDTELTGYFYLDDSMVDYWIPRNLFVDNHNASISHKLQVPKKCLLPSVVVAMLHTRKYGVNWDTE